MTALVFIVLFTFSSDSSLARIHVLKTRDNSYIACRCNNITTRVNNNNATRRNAATATCKSYINIFRDRQRDSEEESEVDLRMFFVFVFVEVYFYLRGFVSEVLLNVEQQ
jgi:hypothetical protein